MYIKNHQHQAIHIRHGPALAVVSAQDVPSRSSEFAHPDVAIGLTILAYRYEVPSRDPGQDDGDRTMATGGWCAISGKACDREMVNVSIEFGVSEVC
jgi:hypothetical protein